MYTCEANNRYERKGNMKKIINRPENFDDKTMEGIMAAYGHL